MEMRSREEVDLDGCERLAQAVHLADDYPPRCADDLRRFVAAPEALAAWVAESREGIIGHALLQPRSSRAVMALGCDATVRSPDQLCVVARLLVSPAHRRRGSGGSLLATSVREPPVVPADRRSRAPRAARWRRLFCDTSRRTRPRTDRRFGVAPSEPTEPGVRSRLVLLCTCRKADAGGPAQLAAVREGTRIAVLARARLHQESFLPVPAVLRIVDRSRTGSAPATSTWQRPRDLQRVDTELGRETVCRVRSPVQRRPRRCVPS